MIHDAGEGSQLKALAATMRGWLRRDLEEIHGRHIPGSFDVVVDGDRLSIRIGEDLMMALVRREPYWAKLISDPHVAD